MEKKIINLSKIQREHTCLICCKNQATVKFAINRPKHDDNVITTHICDECLAQMQSDIHKICE